ncbi:MAG: hypothetical protein ABIO55_18295, partial [Ginsengibacter sp.]
MKKILLLTGVILFWINSDYAQNTWTQKANFSGNARSGATGFSIGSKGYIGTGTGSTFASSNLMSDFWEYDPSTNVWTQKANFGGGARYNSTAFSIGNKGYIATGWAPGRQSDLWEYDPIANTWTQKANIGRIREASLTGFSIGSKGYMGLGTDVSMLNDFWEYDPNTNVWTQKANFAGSARYASTGFSIGNKGYVGTGYDGSLKNDFWEYDPIANIWTQKANFGGGSRANANSFSIGNKGYIGIGEVIRGGSVFYNDFWEYDPVADSWIQKANFGGSARAGATAFSVGGKGYIGTGYDGNFT